MSERRIFAVLSDEPNFLLGISKAKILGDSDCIGCVVSSTPRLSSVIKERVIDIPFKRFIALYPNNSEEFSKQLLSELSLRQTNVVITDPSYLYKISKEFLEKFPGKVFIQKETNSKHSETPNKKYLLLTTKIFHQQPSGSRVDLAFRDIA